MKKRRMVIVTGLIVGAVAVAIVSLVARAEDLRAEQRRRLEEHVATGPPDPLACSPADRSSIVMALGKDYEPEVARGALLRCREDFAYGTVCLSCVASPGPAFGMLLKKTGGGWRYLGSGDSTVIEQLADDAGLEKSALDQLRRGPPR
jgi:hypothetical protein